MNRTNGAGAKFIDAASQSGSLNPDALAGAKPIQPEKGAYAVAAGVSLDQSDISLIANTTGVTIKNGKYYDKDGNPVSDMSSHQDALQLLSLLTDMRSIGVEKSGTAFTAADLGSYAASDKQSGWSSYRDVLKLAEAHIAPTPNDRAA